MSGRAARRWYVLVLAIVFVDQASKLFAVQALEYAQPLPVFMGFNWTLHYNEGAAFSFLSDAGGWQRWFFTALALVVSFVLLAWLRSLERGQWLLALSLSLILGGAVGNLIDRVRLGYVVDFISVYFRDWYFPTFNVADAAISVGAALMILDTLRGDSQAATPAGEG